MVMAGRGSNQYQTKPGGGTADSPANRAAITTAVVDLDSEDVAWQFDPCRSDWANIGETSGAAIRVLIDAGITPQDFAAWQDAGWDAPTAAPWVAERFKVDEANAWRDALPGVLDDPEVAAQWRESQNHKGWKDGWWGFEPDDAAKWINVGLTREEADRWSEYYFSWASAPKWIAGGVTRPATAFNLANVVGVYPEEMKDGRIVAGQYAESPKNYGS